MLPKPLPCCSLIFFFVNRTAKSFELNIHREFRLEVERWRPPAPSPSRRRPERALGRRRRRADPFLFGRRFSFPFRFGSPAPVAIPSSGLLAPAPSGPSEPRRSLDFTFFILVLLLPEQGLSQKEPHANRFDLEISKKNHVPTRAHTHSQRHRDARWRSRRNETGSENVVLL